MATLKFYLDYMSQPCRAIVIFMRMSGIQSSEEIVKFSTAETRKAEYAKVNPMQKVPTMVEGDFTLTESVAILKYLLSKPGVADHWYPNDVRQRARVDEFMAWQQNSYGVRPKAAAVFIEQALKPFRTGKEVNKESLQAAIVELEKALDHMEGYFLSSGQYLAGNDITLADLLAICELMQPASVQYDLTRAHPVLAAWMDRVKSRLEPHFTETHQAIFDFSAPYKMK